MIAWVSLIEAFGKVDDQGDDIGFGSTSPRRIHHGPIKRPAGREYSRGINKHQLTETMDGNAPNRHPRGLHFVGKRSSPWHQRVR